MQRGKSQFNLTSVSISSLTISDGQKLHDGGSVSEIRKVYTMTQLERGSVHFSLENADEVL